MTQILGTVEEVTVRRSRHQQQLLALGVFISSGLLGWLVLATPGLMGRNWTPIPTVDPSSLGLFPLFAGLFGLSSLVLSEATHPDIPIQRTGEIRSHLSRRGHVRGLLTGTVAGSLVSWLPGVSGAAATVVSRAFVKDHEEDSAEQQEEYMVSLSAVGTASSLFTIVALFVILRARSGALVAVREVLGENLVAWEPAAAVPVALGVFLVSALVAGILGLVLSLWLGKVLLRWFTRVDYTNLSRSVLLFLVVLIFLLTGPLGLFIALVATSFGVIPPLIGVRRVHLMGALLVPVILFLLA